MSDTSPQEKPWALILAAGQGSRLSAVTAGCAKQFLNWRDAPLYWHAARALSRSAAVAGIIFVFPEHHCAHAEEQLRLLCRKEDPGLPCLAVAGRQAAAGLRMPGPCRPSRADPFRPGS